jgi:hypothetical protein
MPPPVVLVHATHVRQLLSGPLNACLFHLLSECGVNATLCGDCVRSSREKLGYTGSVETSFSETECSAETGSSSADNNGIVFVVDDGVFARDEA